MKKPRIAALSAGFLFVAISTNAAVKNSTIRIMVLDSETRSVSASNSSVPNDCDQVTFDAYCRSGRAAVLKNTLLVQEDNKPPFRITCTSESRFSRCMPLPKGESFDARKEKHGLLVYYADDNGKARKQLYSFASPESAPAATSSSASQSAAGPAGNTAPAPVAAPPAAVPAPGPSTVAPQETVKCSFTSTPSGAEVSVDGKYVGSTPSTLGLSVGSHVVEVSLPGFTQWKRDLTVSAGSELTVNAILEKGQ